MGHRVPPNPLIDRLALQHLALGFGQQVQQLELAAGEVKAAAADEGLELIGADLELGGDQRAGLLVGAAAAEGRVLEREEIYQRVWGYAMARGDRSVDVFVRKLRHKLEKASPDWRYIHTHFGVGYRFSPEAVEGSAAAAAIEAARRAEPVDDDAPVASRDRQAGPEADRDPGAVRASAAAR